MSCKTCSNNFDETTGCCSDCNKSFSYTNPSTKRPQKFKKIATISLLIILFITIIVLVYIGVTKNRSYNDFVYEITSDDSHKYIVITEYCGDDTTVNIPSQIDGFPVEHIGSMFQNNDFVVSVVIPETVTKIDSFTFKNCGKLKTVKLSNSIEIVDRLFYSCPYLETVNIPTATYIIVNPFKGCYNLKNVTCSEYTIFAEGPKFCSGTYISAFGNNETGIFADCPNVLLNGSPIPIDVTDKDIEPFIDPNTGEIIWR